VYLCAACRGRIDFGGRGAGVLTHMHIYVSVLMYLFMSVHIYMHTCVCVCVCVFVVVCVAAYMHVCVCVCHVKEANGCFRQGHSCKNCMHERIQKLFRQHMYQKLFICIYTNVLVCMCMRGCLHMCDRVYVCVCVRVCHMYEANGR